MILESMEQGFATREKLARMETPIVLTRSQGDSLLIVGLCFAGVAAMFAVGAFIHYFPQIVAGGAYLVNAVAAAFD